MSSPCDSRVIFVTAALPTQFLTNATPSTGPGPGQMLLLLPCRSLSDSGRHKSQANTERAGIREKDFPDLEMVLALRQSLLKIPGAVHSQVLG